MSVKECFPGRRGDVGADTAHEGIVEEESCDLAALGDDESGFCDAEESRAEDASEPDFLVMLDETPKVVERVDVLCYQ